MTKKELRGLYKNKRSLLTSEECKVLDGSILAHLHTLDWTAFAYIHVYLSIAKFNEPDTWGFIQWIKENFPHIHIVISKSDLINGSMSHFLWEENIEIELNKWGIPEPKSGKAISESLIDLVLVPLLIADTHGNRVGYGKGFYDRFLALCRPDVRTIGLSYFEPVESIEDVGDWDKPLDIMITPTNKYEFRK